MSVETYNVYIGEFIGGGTENHHAIYVDDGSEFRDREGNVYPAGMLFHVTGSIQSGMVYEQKPGMDPDFSVTGLGKGSPIGMISKVDYESGRVGTVCMTVPPPQKQFHGVRRLRPGEPLYKCQEWARDAVRALRAARVLQ